MGAYMATLSDIAVAMQTIILIRRQVPKSLLDEVILKLQLGKM
jgi:hypothetical protein